MKSSRRYKTQISVHDRHQIEARFFYPVDRDNKASQTFNLDLYIFLPKVIELSSQRYSKENFYNDLKPFLRLREPKLENIPIKETVDEIRVFACSYASFILKEQETSFQRIRGAVRESAQEDRVRRIRETLEECERIVAYAINTLAQLRKIKKSIPLHERINGRKTFFQEVDFADEYCSYKYRDLLAGFRLVADDCRDFLSEQEFWKLSRRLRALFLAERRYGRKQNYIWVEPETSERERERFVYRRGVLKKHVQKVLYLNLRSKPLFAVQQQLSSIVAASAAAIWATLAEITIRTHFFPLIPGTTTAHFWSLSGFLFVTAFMLAYVLKDRIKEVGRHYFQSHFFMRVPDNSNEIRYPGPVPGQSLGIVQESTRFVPVERLAEEIQQFRSRHAQFFDPEDESSPSCIHYRKVVEIFPSSLANLQFEIPAVQDIIRFSVNSFLAILGDPTHAEFVIDGQGQTDIEDLPKVYYVDLIFVYSDRGAQDGSSFKRCARLVLNKNGLVRIEEL